MIISRTPLRISFVGGGTDLPDFYKEDDGCVFSTSLSKYIYVAVKKQLDIVDFKYRVTWTHAEFQNKLEDIKHPVVREALKLMKVDYPFEVTTFADIPANTGLGSSSSFAVGLFNALYALQGKMASKSNLAEKAVEIELHNLKRNIGKQDHYAAAYGGFNIFRFKRDGSVSVDPVPYSTEKKKRFEQHLLMFYTGIKRDASFVLETQKSQIEVNRTKLRKMRDLVEPFKDAFLSGDIGTMAEILDVNWELKRTLANSVSSEKIEDLYKSAKAAGALAGKLLGAGGGGFLLFMVAPDKQDSVKQALFSLHCQNVTFDNEGSKITYYDPSLWT